MLIIAVAIKEIVTGEVIAKHLLNVFLEFSTRTRKPRLKPC